MTTHLRANAIAWIALFVALGGTGAVAAQLVTSNELAPRAVKSRHVASNAVKSRHIGPGQVRRADVRPGAVNGALVEDNTLGGADIHEASLAGFAASSQPHVDVRRIELETLGSGTGDDRDFEVSWETTGQSSGFTIGDEAITAQVGGLYLVTGHFYIQVQTEFGLSGPGGILTNGRAAGRNEYTALVRMQPGDSLRLQLHESIGNTVGLDCSRGAPPVSCHSQADPAAQLIAVRVSD